MNPKDKAEELIDKYKDIRWDIDPETAKQGALIAIDEIIKVLYDANDTDEEYGYWTDVKQELEEL